MDIRIKICAFYKSKAAVTALDSYLINSKLAVDYLKSLMKPASTILHNKYEYKHQNIRN